MSLGMEVGLGPGDIALHMDPAPPPPKRGAQELPLFSPCVLWPNGWMDEDDTYTEVGLGPGHIVLDGDPAAPKKGAQQFHVSAHVHCGQTVAHFSNC